MNNHFETSIDKIKNMGLKECINFRSFHVTFQTDVKLNSTH
jgi:hypothetical protein